MDHTGFINGVCFDCQNNVLVKIGVQPSLERRERQRGDRHPGLARRSAHVMGSTPQQMMNHGGWLDGWSERGMMRGYSTVATTDGNCTGATCAMLVSDLCKMEAHEAAKAAAAEREAAEEALQAAKEAAKDEYWVC
jgi:hypothetical protein